MPRRFVSVFLGLVVTSVNGQVTGAICTKDPSHPEGSPNLCIPKFCKAPNPFNQQIRTGALTFRSTFSGVAYAVNFTPPSYTDGYDLANICGDHISLAVPAEIFDPDAPPSPPPPLYSRASTTPEGCAAISPLPTLLQAADLDLIAIWVILIIYLFYALAMVCEEFLVPAINILCVKTGIPDDVAGATLLAAGCNSPEFFASIIGIFIADSTVGVGTVIGSAPFNLCCITGGSALALGGSLCLDPWLMGRELLALLTALLLFLIFMDDYLIMWWEALIMVCFYGLIYVPVLGNFDRIRGFILQHIGAHTTAAPMLGEDGTLAIDYTTGGSRKLDGGADGAVDLSGMKVTPSAASGLRGQLAASLSASLMETAQFDFSVASMKERALAQRVPSDIADGMSIELRPVAIPTKSARVRDTEGGGGNSPYDVLVEQCRRRVDGYADSDAGFSGVLMKKPRGFTKVRVRGILWQARYFVLDHHPTNPLRYSHADQKTKFVTVPLQSVSTVSRVGQEELQLTTATQVYKLRLPTGEPAETMQRWFDQIIVKIHEMGAMAPPPQQLEGELHEEAHEHPPWYQMPDSPSGRVVHVLTFVLKALVFTTTPNVLIQRNEKYYPLTIVISMVWLAIFAILMTDIIEYLGCGIGVSSTVMGLSLGAIGTSFPNLYASILVARAGQGGMAICQAIASNTFNICICLALLWLLHTIGVGSCDYGSHGAKQGFCSGCYAPSGFTPLCPFFEGTNNAFGSTAGSTKGAVIVSLIWVAFFLLTLTVYKMHVRKLPAYVMFVIYILYIVYQFADAFGAPITICFASVNICI